MLTYSPLTGLLQADNGGLESVRGVQRRRHKRENNVPEGCCMYVRQGYPASSSESIIA